MGGRLVPAWGVDCGPRPRVREVAGVLGEVLSGGWAPGLRVEGGAAVGESRLLCWALRFLGARLLPVGSGAPLEALGVYDALEDPPLGLVYSSPLELAGAPTPLVRLGVLWGVEVWAKLEYYHPLSLSVKERAVLGILEGRGVGRGSLVVEASSSNTAVALAAASGPLGLRAVAVLPGSAPAWGRLALRVYGAELVESRAASTVEAVGEAVRIARERGGVHLDQFSCDWNFIANLRGTGLELDYQLRVAGVKPSAVVVSVGTCGHGCAVAFVARHRRPQALRVAAHPAPGEGIPGIRPPDGQEWLDLAGFDVFVPVSRREALEAGVEAARASGVLPSPSGGAALAAVRRLVGEGRIPEGSSVAVVIPDTGYKYLDLYASALGGGGG